MDSHDSTGSQAFVAHLTASQQSLYAFVLSLVPNTSDARDILAETNLALWRKRDEFDPRCDFWPWACQFGKLQVLAFKKRRQRDRLVFNEEILELLAAEAVATDTGGAADALGSCLGGIDARQQELLRKRYSGEYSVQRLAAEMNRSAGAMADWLYRIRLQLANCIERKLAATE